MAGLAETGETAGEDRRRVRPGSRCRRGRGRGLGNLGANDIDIALEIRAVFDHDARRADIAHQLGFLADVDPVAGLDVPMQATQHDDLFRLHAGADLSLQTDGEAVFLHFYGAFHFAVDGQVLAAKNLPFHDDRFSEHGIAGARRIKGLCGAIRNTGHWTCLLGGLRLDRLRRRRSRLSRDWLGCWLFFFFTPIPHLRASPCLNCSNNPTTVAEFGEMLPRPKTLRTYS